MWDADRLGPRASSRPLATEWSARDRFGAPKQIALRELDAQPSQRGRLTFRFHAFGDEMAAATEREVHKTGRKGLAELVSIDPPDEADIELRERRPQLEDMAQARVAGPGVIDRKLHATESPDRLAERSVILDGDMFSQLEDESSTGRPEHLSK